MEAVARLSILIVTGIAALAYADLQTYQKNKEAWVPGQPEVKFDFWCAFPRWVTGAVAGIGINAAYDAILNLREN